VAFIAARPLSQLYISVVTLAEIRYGIERVGEPNRRAELNDWLAHKVRPMFGGRVLPITEDILPKWRLLVDEGRKVGHTFSQPDLLIAATALYHQLTVVSQDPSEYDKARVPVINRDFSPGPEGRGFSPAASTSSQLSPCLAARTVPRLRDGAGREKERGENPLPRRG
jgi:hypothetical protein